MASVRVITDSACDISRELADEHDIGVVPLTIRFGSEEFLDRAQLSIEEFWRRCTEAKALPQTSAPSPGAFDDAFRHACETACDGILVITISASLSGTYQSACTAAEQFDAVPVKVVDSRSVTMGEGILALAAAQDARDGFGLEEIAARSEERISRTHVIGVVDTLDHLQRGGRIGGAAALLGSLLSIKPVVQVKDGVVAEESKQRTRSRSLRYIVDKVTNEAPFERLAICNGMAGDIDLVSGPLSELPAEHRLLDADLGPVVGTHTGPGSIGVCYLSQATQSRTHTVR